MGGRLPNRVLIFNFPVARKMEPALRGGLLVETKTMFSTRLRGRRNEPNRARTQRAPTYLHRTCCGNLRWEHHSLVHAGVLVRDSGRDRFSDRCQRHRSKSGTAPGTVVGGGYSAGVRISGGGGNRDSQHIYNLFTRSDEANARPWRVPHRPLSPPAAFATVDSR